MADDRDATEGPGEGTFAMPVVDGPDGPMARVQSYPSEDEANEAARTLVEQGIGATVVDAGWAYELRVVPEMARRAGEVLGLLEPDPEAGGQPLDGAKPPKAKLPMKQVLLIWLAMFILVPLVAGLASYFLVSR